MKVPQAQTNEGVAEAAGEGGRKEREDSTKKSVKQRARQVREAGRQCGGAGRSTACSTLCMSEHAPTR